MPRREGRSQHAEEPMTNVRGCATTELQEEDEKSTSTMVKIVPKSKCKVDICCLGKYYYIIRPDLTCYLRSTNFHNGDDLQIFSLHPSCRNGDHYLTYEDGYFYIIESNNYRQVSNLNNVEHAAVKTLHPNCQGGDHYFSALGYFYIIFQGRNVYRRTKNMDKDEEGKEFSLHQKCKDGLYYFGTKDYYYFVSLDDQQGIQYTRCTNLNTNENAQTFSFHTRIYSFLPGGAAIAKGPAYGKWVCIKIINNDSETPVECQEKVTKKVGYDKETIASIGSSWKVLLSVLAETGGLSVLIAKKQFSLATEYGGIGTNTENENWSEATEIEEILTLTLKPKQQICIFTYQLGLGKEPMLYCQHMRIIEGLAIPTDNPLPRAV